MFYYFSADFDCALKIDGKYITTLNDFAHKTQSQTPLFVEACELTNQGETHHILTKPEYLQNPPKSVAVVDLKGGYFIKFLQKLVMPFGIITQLKNEFLVATLFYENGLKLSIETPNAFYAEDLEIQLDSASFSLVKCDNEVLLCLYTKGKFNNLLIFTLAPSIKKVFSMQVNDFNFAQNLFTTIIYKDIAKHKVVSEWNFNNGQFVKINSVITTSDKYNYQNLSPSIKPFAFFEEVLVGGEFLQLLTPNMQKNAHKLKSYLGDFSAIITPPPFREKNEVGLLYKVKPRFYSVNYYSLTFQNDKIDNIVFSQ